MSSAPSYVTTFPVGSTSSQVNLQTGVAFAPISSVLTATNSSVCSFTPSSAGGVFRVGGVITLTSGTNTGTVILGVTYTDSQGQLHTADVIPLAAAAGTVTLTGATGASTEWKGVELTLTSGATAITILATVAGSVHYTVSAYILPA